MFEFCLDLCGIDKNTQKFIPSHVLIVVGIDVKGLKEDCVFGNYLWICVELIRTLRKIDKLNGYDFVVACETVSSLIAFVVYCSIDENMLLCYVNLANVISLSKNRSHSLLVLLLCFVFLLSFYLN